MLKFGLPFKAEKRSRCEKLRRCWAYKSNNFGWKIAESFLSQLL